MHMYENDFEVEKIFAALKLIEVLYTQGIVPEHIWKNIKDEYKHVVDLSQFV